MSTNGNQAKAAVRGSATLFGGTESNGDLRGMRGVFVFDLPCVRVDAEGWRGVRRDFLANVARAKGAMRCSRVLPTMAEMTVMLLLPAVRRKKKSTWLASHRAPLPSR